MSAAAAAMAWYEEEIDADVWGHDERRPRWEGIPSRKYYARGGNVCRVFLRAKKRSKFVIDKAVLTLCCLE